MDLIISHGAPKNWDKLVSSHSSGNIFQTTFWANFIKNYLKMDPVYLCVKDGKKVHAMLLAFKSSLAHKKLFNSPFKFILPISKKIFPQYSWQFGPLVFSNSNKSLSQLLSFFSDKTVKMVTAPIYSNEDQQFFKESFLKIGFKSTPATTFLVNLTNNFEILEKNMKKKARKNAKNCAKETTVKITSNEEELKEAYDLLAEFRKKQNLPYFDFGNYTEMKKYLGEYLSVFLVRKDKKPIACLGIISFNGIIREIASAQSEFCLNEKIYANDFLKYKIINWGNQNHFKLYDLAGVSPDPKTAKEEGIKKFKEKWGGKQINYYIYSK